MNVLMLAPGDAIHTRRLVDLLIREGCRITLVDWINPGRAESDTYRFVRMPRVRGDSYESFRRHLEVWVRALQFRRLWHALAPDIVNVQWVDIRARACALAGIRPLVLSCWGSDINNLFAAAAPAHARRSMGRALARADAVTADSREVLERCERLAGRKLVTELFYYGIDATLFKPGYAKEAASLRMRLGIAGGSRIILSPRRVLPKLGQRYILDAFGALAQDRAFDNVVLLFRYYAGSSEAHRQELLERIATLDLGSRVFWLEDTPYEEVPWHYALADVVVNYPEQDALPVSLFEATMCKRPVVSSRLAAYEGIFGDAVVVVPPADVAGLTDALKRCLNETPDERSRRTNKAYATAMRIGEETVCIKVMTSLFARLARASG